MFLYPCNDSSLSAQLSSLSNHYSTLLPWDQLFKLLCLLRFSSRECLQILVFSSWASGQWLIASQERDSQLPALLGGGAWLEGAVTEGVTRKGLVSLSSLSLTSCFLVTMMWAASSRRPFQHVLPALEPDDSRLIPWNQSQNKPLYAVSVGYFVSVMRKQLEQYICEKMWYLSFLCLAYFI